MFWHVPQTFLLATIVSDIFFHLFFFCVVPFICPRGLLLGTSCWHVGQLWKKRQPTSPSCTRKRAPQYIYVFIYNTQSCKHVLRCIAWHCITFHYVYITLLYITLHLHYIRYIVTLHYITLHGSALHCTTLHHIKLSYSTVHYITNFLWKVAFWSIRSSGLLRWFCVTDEALLMIWPHFFVAGAVL